MRNILRHLIRRTSYYGCRVENSIISGDFSSGPKRDYFRGSNHSPREGGATWGKIVNLTHKMKKNGFGHSAGEGGNAPPPICLPLVSTSDSKRANTRSLMLKMFEKFSSSALRRNRCPISEMLSVTNARVFLFSIYSRNLALLLSSYSNTLFNPGKLIKKNIVDKISCKEFSHKSLQIGPLINIPNVFSDLQGAKHIIKFFFLLF